MLDRKPFGGVADEWGIIFLPLLYSLENIDKVLSAKCSYHKKSPENTNFNYLLNTHPLHYNTLYECMFDIFSLCKSESYQLLKQTT